MPKFGAHASCWIDRWTTEKGNRAIAGAAAIGFDFIEIPLLKPAEFDAPSHRQALQAAGIGATASVVLPADAHMPKYPEKARKFLLEAMDKLCEIGGTYLCGCIAYNLGTLTGQPPTEAERQTVVDTLRLVADDAKARGITLGFECCNRYETYMYNVLADGREVILAAGAENLELHADTYHMNIEEEDFYKPLVENAAFLGYIHMSESHRGMVGTGTVNWEQVFRGLTDARFTGYMALESFSAGNPDMAAATRVWRPSKYSIEELMTRGLQFLREGSHAAALA